MSDQNTPPEDSRTKYSPGLRLAASKGKFSTRFSSGHPVRVPEPLSKIVAATATDGGPDPFSPAMSWIKNTRVSPDTEISYRTPRHDDLPIAVANGDQEPLAANRSDIKDEDPAVEMQKKRELFVTAAAAKSLTRLFASLALEPGSGSEIPAHIRTQVLDTLIRESHILADSVCSSVMTNGKPAPTYLRAKLLQQAVEFVSDQWVEHGRIDTSALKELAQKAFSGGVDSITQEISDLFHAAGEFTPANDEEISQARITESTIRATWGFIRQINHFDLRDYDPEADKSGPSQPFHYGKDQYQIASDLTRIALRITQENALAIENIDIRTTWTQNAIDRASSLVKAEYRLLTDRALRSCFRDDLFSEAAIHHVNGLYSNILEKVQNRAHNGFVLVEKSAIDAMSANAYRHYLPKRGDGTASRGASTEPNVESKSGTSKTVEQQESSIRKFSFFRQKNG